MCQAFAIDPVVFSMGALVGTLIAIYLHWQYPVEFRGLLFKIGDFALHSPVQALLVIVIVMLVWENLRQLIFQETGVCIPF